MAEADESRTVFGLVRPGYVSAISFDGINWIKVADGKLEGRGRNVFTAKPFDANPATLGDRIAVPVGRIAAVRYGEKES